MKKSMTHRLRKTSNIITRGAMVEAFGGAIAIVLTIISFWHLASTYLMSFATIALGIGILLQGTSVAYEYSDLDKLVGEEKFKNFNLGTGLSFEIFAGGIVFAIGILVLGFAPTSVLIPVASIILGIAIILSSRTLLKVNDFKIFTTESGMPIDSLARETIDAAFGIQIIIGMAAVTLGILGLDGISTLLLTTIAILSLGFSILLNGLAISGRLSSITGY